MKSALDLVQEELNQIQALGNTLGTVMLDEAGVNQEYIATLCYLVFHLGKKAEEKLSTFDRRGLTMNKAQYDK
jgi:hypothetical protein